MKPRIYALSIILLAMATTLSSCSKFDCFPWKDHESFKFPGDTSDCDVQRVTFAEADGTRVEMEKSYNAEGRIETIGFYTYAGAAGDVFWHRFSLSYNESARTIDITDSASGLPVLKARFNHSGQLERLERLQGDASDFADRQFVYAGGRLVKINSHWKTFDDTEAFTYDANGNIATRETTTSTGIVAEASTYTYGASATDKKQFYIPQYNYLIVVDPSMTMLEYLRWIKDFSPKNILTHIEYLQPLPSGDDFSDPVFDSAGKLTSYSNGDFVGGTRNIEWRCEAE